MIYVLNDWKGGKLGQNLRLGVEEYQKIRKKEN